ncbi:MAG TPA: invasion associated locus B family protein [Xanthobacteraceae bacterium]|nr:invasion associated locus B family protein [Xanthobacteraceae bacterium]
MAQQLPAAAPATAPATAAPPAKPKPKPKSPATPAAAPAAKPEGSAPAKPAVTNGARLLGQYGQWGAYTASPSGKKVCFVISQPTSAQTVPPNRPRNPVYMFISTRPADKVVNEVSVIAGYPFKPSLDATAAVGSTTFALYTQQDGAWIKNAGDEANMLSAMRAGDSIVVKGVSAKGTQSSDTYTLKGISQALDRVAQECK